jgi:SAM-dependent methyltransferase
VSEAANLVERLLENEPDIAFRRRARTIVEYIQPREGQRVLDAGCGLGFYLALLDRVTTATVCGLDTDLPRLKQAARESRAAIAAASVTALPFPEATFDAVILSEVLEHLPDDQPAVAEAFRVLKPGGVLAVTVPHQDYPFLWDPANYARERLGMGHFTSEPLSGIWTDHRRLYQPAQLRDLVVRCGFEVDDLHLETRHSFPFAHLMVYGVGKLLIEKRLVANGAATSRASIWGEEHQTPVLRALTSVFTAPDRFNQERYETGPAVSLCLKAVKRAEPNAASRGA